MRDHFPNESAPESTPVAFNNVIIIETAESREIMVTALPVVGDRTTSVLLPTVSACLTAREKITAKLRLRVVVMGMWVKMSEVKATKYNESACNHVEFTTRI